MSLAVSGGPDSMALMVLAGQAGLDAAVVHVDHGLRPGGEEEAARVAAAAAELGFRFRCERVEVPAGPDLEARARRARYGVLPEGVLTGHTMDDQAETVLLNLLWGSGMDGLAGIREPADLVGSGPGTAARLRPGPAGRPAVRRPLIGLRRAETAEVCRQAGIIPVADPSNCDPRFRRNRIRHELLPVLNAIAARDVVPVLARQAALIGEDVELLEGLAASLDPTDVPGLRAAPPPLARRALRGWLRAGPERHPPSSAELARVMDVVAGRFRACQVSGARRVGRRSGRLYLSEGR